MELVVSPEGLVHYGGAFYDDWSVTDDAVFDRSPDLQAMHVPFRPELAAIPKACSAVA